MIVLFWCANVFAAAGVVDMLEGRVSIVSSGATRVARVGGAVEEGDSVQTAAGAWALIHMADGAIITVRPATQFTIETYRHIERQGADNPADSLRSVLLLSEGALRVVTGAIGKKNRAGYALKTPSATIGIRGTDHETAYFSRDATDQSQRAGTYDRVYSGGTILRGLGGEVHVNPGQSGFADRFGRAPPGLLEREPRFYGVYRALDVRVAPRREELLRKLEPRRGSPSSRINDVDSNRHVAHDNETRATTDERNSTGTQGGGVESGGGGKQEITAPRTEGGGDSSGNGSSGGSSGSAGGSGGSSHASGATDGGGKLNESVLRMSGSRGGSEAGGRSSGSTSRGGRTR